jgi:uncharacterized spore protein YtfJ
MSEILSELRSKSKRWAGEGSWTGAALLDDAVKVIEEQDKELVALRARAEAAEGLREALEPLSRMDLKALQDKRNDYPVFGLNDSTITVGDIRKATAALAAYDKSKPH